MLRGWPLWAEPLIRLALVAGGLWAAVWLFRLAFVALWVVFKLEGKGDGK